MNKIFLFFASILFFAAVANGQTLNWVKSQEPLNPVQFSETSINKAVDVDDYNSVYTIGSFFDTVDFNPGVGIFNMVGGAGEPYVQKLDSNGNFVWAINLDYNFGGIMTAITSLTIDKNNDIILTGHFSGTVDFDPGPGIMNLNSGYTSVDMFIMKLGINGNLIWVKNIGSDYNEAVGLDVNVDLNNDIVVTCEFNFSIDVDPSAITYVLPHGTNIIKYSSQGNYIWGKNVSNVYNQFWMGYQGYLSEIKMTTIDKFNNIYTTGYFNSTSDFDPSANVFNLNGPGVFIQKLNTNGNFIWAKEFNTNSNSIPEIDVDSAGHIYTTRAKDSTSLLIDYYKIIIEKLDTNGNSLWMKKIMTVNDNPLVFSDFRVNSMKTNGLGHLFITGIVGDTLEVDAATNLYLQTPLLGYNSFLIEYNNLGNVVNAYLQKSVIQSINTKNNNLYLSGYFLDTADVDFLNTVYNINTISVKEFVAKYGTCVPTTSTTNTSICSSQLPYIWNGQSFTTSGNHTYQTTNAVGCDSISTLNLTINNIPLSNIIPYTDSTICIGAPIVLYADTNYSNYSWTLNGNVVSATDSVIINSSGSYLLSCTDSNNCSLSDSVSFTLNPTPQPIIIQNNYILYTANIANAYYQWSLNGTILSNNDSITITQNGLYILIVTSTSGCIGIDTFIVSALGLNNYSNNNLINIYPNPTDNILTIDYVLEKSSNVNIRLLDMTGKVILLTMKIK